MAKKQVKVKAKMEDACMCCNDSYWSCCMSWVGAIHVAGGVGVGFLLAHYLSLPLAVLGWVLVGASVLGHFSGKMKCDHC